VARSASLFLGKENLSRHFVPRLIRMFASHVGIETHGVIRTSSWAVVAASRRKRPPWSRGTCPRPAVRVPAGRKGQLRYIPPGYSIPLGDTSGGKPPDPTPAVTRFARPRLRRASISGHRWSLALSRGRRQRRASRVRPSARRPALPDSFPRRQRRWHHEAHERGRMGTRPAARRGSHSIHLSASGSHERGAELDMREWAPPTGSVPVKSFNED
jgi:hypothetical protein